MSYPRIFFEVVLGIALNHKCNQYLSLNQNIYQSPYLFLNNIYTNLINICNGTTQPIQAVPWLTHTLTHSVNTIPSNKLYFFKAPHYKSSSK